MADRVDVNGVIIEEGVVAGNFYNKYKTKNPIARYFMQGFINSVMELVAVTHADDIHEVGCGEGYLSAILAKGSSRIRASDFSQQVIDKAQAITKKTGINIDFKVAGIYDLIPGKDMAELVVCCEVLEHLEHPQRAMGVLSTLANPYLLVSVPREPIWRLLNMARGKYIGSVGNTPGHIQHWSKKSFLNMLNKYVNIVKVLTPLPWTIALCHARKNDG